MKDLPKRKGDLPSKYSSTAGVSTAGVGQRSRHSCRFCSRLRRAAASYSALERPDRFFFSRNFLYAAVSFSFVSQPQLNGSVHGEKLRSFGPFRGSGRSFSYGLNIPLGKNILSRKRKSYSCTAGRLSIVECFAVLSQHRSTSPS